MALGGTAAPLRRWACCCTELTSSSAKHRLTWTASGTIAGQAELAVGLSRMKASLDLSRWHSSCRHKVQKHSFMSTAATRLRAGCANQPPNDPAPLAQTFTHHHPPLKTGCAQRHLTPLARVRRLNSTATSAAGRHAGTRMFAAKQVPRRSWTTEAEINLGGEIEHHQTAHYERGLRHDCTTDATGQTPDCT